MYTKLVVQNSTKQDPKLLQLELFITAQAEFQLNSRQNRQYATSNAFPFDGNELLLKMLNYSDL